MMYDEEFIEPMRQELVDAGFIETKTPEAVEQEIENAEGPVLVVVNSVCGCGAASARPGVVTALGGAKKPSKCITVFAGNDAAATAKARSYFVGYQPSSPSVALLKDGEVVHMMERHQINGRSPEEIGLELQRAFEKHC